MDLQVVASQERVEWFDREGHLVKWMYNWHGFWALDPKLVDKVFVVGEDSQEG